MQAQLAVCVRSEDAGYVGLRCEIRAARGTNVTAPASCLRQGLRKTLEQRARGFGNRLAGHRMLAGEFGQIACRQSAGYGKPDLADQVLRV